MPGKIKTQVYYIKDKALGKAIFEEHICMVTNPTNLIYLYPYCSINYSYCFCAKKLLEIHP